jgi:hypothetical protein
MGEVSAEQRRDVLWLLLLSLAVRLGSAALIRRPGTMDAAYYAAGAVRLAEGGGLSEPFIWNYLDDPSGIPHPGFLYWMPMPSLLAALGAVLWPGSFFALQLPGALLGALLPPLTVLLARRLVGRRLLAWLAGLVMLFSGFFFPFWTLPETFAPYALFGSLAVVVMGWADGPPGRAGRPGPLLRALCGGALAGLAHLTRADGVLVLAVVLLGSLLHAFDARAGRDVAPGAGRRRLLRCAGGLLRCAGGLRRCARNDGVGWALAGWGAALGGYLLVMGPWFARNVALVGAPLSPAGGKTLWLRSYDDLYCAGCELSLRSYLAWGWEGILRSKLWALHINLQRFLAEDCLVFLLPLVLVGFYRLRRERTVMLTAVYLAAAFAVHTFAFTFPGPRGGFFHASAAALPVLFAAAAEGLDASVAWLGRYRRWNRQQARCVFSAAAVLGAVALSGYAAWGRWRAWWNADEPYVQLGGWLAQRGEGGVPVMVANPPAFWYYTRLPAIAVPNNGPEETVAVARRYGARYVILDANRPQPLAALYAGEEAHPALRLRETGVEGLRVYALSTEER